MNNFEDIEKILEQLGRKQMDQKLYAPIPKSVLRSEEQMKRALGDVVENITIENHSKLLLEAEKLLSGLGLGLSQPPSYLTGLNQGLKVTEIIKQMDQRLQTPIPESILRLETQEQRLFGDIRQIERQRQFLLERAISPLPDLSSLIDSNSRLFPEIERSIRHINDAIASAEYLGTVEINNDEEIEVLDVEDDDIKESIIQRVEFFPIKDFLRICNNTELMKGLSGRDFEKFFAELIDKIGFEDIILTPSSGDQGRDVIAHKKFNGINIIFAFQCKRYKNEIQPDKIRELMGTIMLTYTRANIGVLATTSTFSQGAKKIILTEPRLDGKDFNDLVNWIQSIKS